MTNTNRTRGRSKKYSKRNTARRTNVRLSKEVSQKREAEAEAFFEKNPEATGAALNKMFTDRGDPMMNIAKVYKLRNKVRAKVAASGQTAATSAPAAATGTDSAPVIPAVEFENARRIAGRGAARAAGADVLPFDRVTSEAKKLWGVMQASGCSAATIVEGKLHLTGKFQTTLALS